MISRRQMLGSAALAAAAAQAQAEPRNIVISSWNGLRACAKAMELLKAGKDTLDAVIAGVNINELDPEDNTVGYGGLPNEEGVVELDASVMHGPTRRCGFRRRHSQYQDTVQRGQAGDGRDGSRHVGWRWRAALRQSVRLRRG